MENTLFLNLFCLLGRQGGFFKNRRFFVFLKPFFSFLDQASKEVFQGEKCNFKEFLKYFINIVDFVGRWGIIVLVIS
jgi:hypothetical protein